MQKVNFNYTNSIIFRVSSSIQIILKVSVFNSNYFRLTYQVVGKFDTVPALVGADEFGGLNLFHCCD